MTNSVNTREVILDCLLAVTKEQAFLHVVMRDVLAKYAYLDKRDRSFISRVCHGTMERMPELDGIINQFSKVSVRKMKPVIRLILRSALYQMLYMDSVPNSAAVNEAVKLASKRGFSGLKGFVNGVLRNIDRNLATISYPSRDHFIDYMEMRYSIFPWMTKLWLTSMSEEQVEAIGEAFLKEGPTCVRVMTDRITPQALMKQLVEQGITVATHETREDVLYLSSYDSLGAIKQFRDGLFYVQDPSSMEVATVIKPKAGEIGVDVCAAPGGKSIHAAMLLKEQEQQTDKKGRIYARDLTPMKLALIEENIARTGMDNITAEIKDARVLDEAMVEKADFVIADLPCSGLGVLRKKPDIKYRTSLDNVRELAQLQQEILAVVCQYVKPGGRLLYSTCTINRIENEENVETFLKEHSEFTRKAQQQLLPKDGKQDGFFYCLLEKGAK
ncbi:16S rRNA (cytosine967-C5)-methyltransferase [Lachnospiraceae bacterium XBB1006]|nr:16S rRNA (cytosine967-C5)-methyltransferase [Lachnospiraceae bacterium XBB1006]